MRVATTSQNHSSRNFTSLLGNTFGRLTVISRASNGKHRDSRWWCRCQCGTEKVVDARHLKSERILSCGCFWMERITTHGQSGSNRTPTYAAWVSAKSRCFNPKNKDFKNWGGRGISMCQEWADDFLAFCRHMGPRPDGLTLDRKDNDGDYEPGNCRWATWKEQAQNKRARVVQ